MPSLRRHTPVACAAVAAASALLAGCGDATATEIVCAAIHVPAVVAEVRDAAGAPIADGARLTLRSAVRPGAAPDTVTGVGAPLELASRTTRADIYTVTVAKDGYAPAVVEDVVAPGTACGVERSIVVPVTLHPRGTP